MLIRIGNVIINTNSMIDAKFTEKGEHAVLIVRYALSTKTGESQRVKLTDENARAVWNLLCTEAEELPYTGED